MADGLVNLAPCAHRRLEALNVEQLIDDAPIAIDFYEGKRVEKCEAQVVIPNPSHCRVPSNIDGEDFQPWRQTLIAGRGLLAGYEVSKLRHCHVLVAVREIPSNPGIGMKRGVGFGTARFMHAVEVSLDSGSDRCVCFHDANLGAVPVDSSLAQNPPEME